MHETRLPSVQLPIEQRPRLTSAGYHRIPPSDKSFMLPDLWSLLLFHYDMQAAFDGCWVQVQAGMIALLPPGVHKHYRHRGNELFHHVCHFRLRGQGPRQMLPRLIDSGAHYPALRDQLHGACAWFANDPLRAEIRLWDVLHGLKDLAPEETRTCHPAVTAALRIMERHLDRECSISAMAEQVGLSHGHFSTLFKTQLGSTPLQWLLRRRMERARHLLIHSTMPIATIAESVGYSDLQHFNKAVRRALGRSPRAVRQGEAQGGGAVQAH